jgi:DNA-binding transcriptional MocR family regulator
MDRIFRGQAPFFDNSGPPRYEQLARAIQYAVAEGRVSPGDRLPTIRQFASQLRVSATTVTAAFELLEKQGLIRPEVGRGTFVADRSQDLVAAPVAAASRPVARTFHDAQPVPWRRRALMSLGNRLRASYPQALDCSTGRPDPALLPLAILQRALQQTSRTVAAGDLQYAGPEPTEALATRLTSLLTSDEIPARPQDLLIAGSTQQVLTLSLDVMIGLWGAEQPVVALEEPGYPTLLDTYERAGARVIGIGVDDYGAVPDSLDAALAAGAKAVVLTPRALNPTGACWTRERSQALADVLASHTEVIVLEDDQFAGVSVTRTGSLLSDARIEERVIYVRSFSKAIAPDLRTAVAVARPHLRDMLREAKSFGDGWTSRLLQQTLAAVLGDDGLDEVLNFACQSYRDRRRAAAEIVSAGLAPLGGSVSNSRDGLSFWVQLPPRVDAHQVVEQAACAGVRVAEGGAFFVRPGRSDSLRFSIGAVQTEQAVEAARALTQSVLAGGTRITGPIHV